MPQPTDITLDGAGYMIAPGTYKRAQDGMPEGRTGRITFADFFGGLRRHLQLERDRSFAGEHVGPALNGQGVQPWGLIDGPHDLPGTTPAPVVSQRVPNVIIENRVHFAIQNRLIRMSPGGGTALGATLIYSPGTPFVDMCAYASNGVLITYGPGRDIEWVRSSDSAVTVLVEGERGYAIGAYGGYAMYVDARPEARRTYVRQVTGTDIDIRLLDFDIREFVQAGAHIYAITEGAIYSYSGRVRTFKLANPAYTSDNNEPETIESMEWSGDWTPFFQHGVNAQEDDFRFFVGFGGDVLAWVAGEVMLHKATGERAGWRSTGLAGRRCFGGCVAGGYAVVSIESHEGRNELWAWDGSGWWMIAQKPMTANGFWIWPINLNNAGQWDLMVFHHNQTTYDVIRLKHRTAVRHAYSPTASFVTPMIDAGERDKTKAWRKIGATFASPERSGNLASTDAVTVYLEYSLDGGASWIAANPPVSLSGNTQANQTFELDRVISGSSRWIMLRVRWTSVSDWAPVLTGLWAEFEILDSPARRRKWQFAVIARDQTIDRVGGALTRTGRQLIADLWSAWEHGTTVSFRDIDYDDAPVTRTARIVGIAEDAPKPSDHGRWGDSVVSLKLVEV